MTSNPAQKARHKHRPHVHGLVLLLILTAVGYATISNAPFNSERSAFAAPVSGLSMPAATTNAAVADKAVVRAGTNNKTLPGATGMVVAPSQEVGEDIHAFNAPPEPSPTATAAPVVVEEDAIVREAAEPIPAVLPAYQVHTAVDGDSVYSIAEQYGISAEYILANNAELAASGFLEIGQSVIIPAGNGILHEVRYGETLSDIAARYDVDVEVITGFASNGIADANSLMETQVVFVPNAAIIQAAPFEEEPTEDEIAEEDTSDEDSESADDSVSEDDGSGDDSADDTIVGGGPSSSAGLVWPLGGPVSSPYGSGHPLGIDIDGFYLEGAAIAAATSGTVLFAGGNACCSYGLYVVIMSDSGVETLYAHMNSLYVTQGEYVSQGQAIGVVGSTGYSTGTHVHFEVIDNGVRQNPLNYLP